MPVFIGTSGWQYKDWRGRLYPADLAQARWLEHFALQFQTVEVNNAFYRLPEVHTFQRWRDTVPGDFIMAVKASRYLTHIRRLKDPQEPVHRLMSRAHHLGASLGPILLQLPPNFQVDLSALAKTLQCFSPGTRVAFEPRHDSWFNPSLASLLRDHNAALCLSDARGPKGPLWRTADWGYLRMHEGRAQPHSCYGRTALQSWAGRVAELWETNEEVFVYFNNDHGGCAVRDAHRFARSVRDAGLSPTRVPDGRAASLRLARL
ncbi:MAG TPA: DUF72 domain-containing protein [Acidimicrobiales bacterium]|jgi:uncharacterized protein YecE (DUF72 family)|nr:DUF72 domain-containing protein [Acidimicrobiales bacterium]